LSESHLGTRPRGRFAPSPTGPLHFGSLVAAVGSFADARAAGGSWLVRIDDLDRAREVPGAADDILRTLERFGLLWDETVVYQSQRTEAYAQALEQLSERGLTFPCACSRAEIARQGRPGKEGPIYPGTCRNGLPAQCQPRSQRMRVDAVRIAIADRIQGLIQQTLATDVGDFVLRRADGIHAYQLAVVLDDAAAGIDSIVRGADLLMSTPRQVYLQRLLGLPQPSYAHLPVVIDDEGRKLSKTLSSAPVDPVHPLPALVRAWRFLGQAPLPDSVGSVRAFWQQAIAAWSLERVPRVRTLPPEPQ
jgi:glutamyl-Q tRNA(Asp) synthetase